MVSGRDCRASALAILCLLSASLTAGLLPAETVTSGEIYMNTTSAAGENSLGIRLGFDQANTDDVKASIQVSLDNENMLTLDRAYIKTRFPWIVEDTSLRFTAGKAPLSWGKGFVFNSGDPVFGATPPMTTISNSSYRNAADLMGVLYLPLSGFSFAEFLYLPAIEKKANRAGGRIYVTPNLALLQSVEAGYLFTEGAEYNFYSALDGSLFFDYYASASASASAAAFQKENRVLSVSFGLFRIFRFIPDIPVSLRAEGLVYPEHDRQLWYQSIQASLTDSLSLSLQGLFATGKSDFTTGSGLCGIVCSWSPLKGFTLSGTVFKYIEKGDLLKKDAIVQLGLLYLF